MFGPVTIPFGVRMLFNTVKLKPGVSIDDVEVALAEMCNVVKEIYGGQGGFVAGQVMRFAGFVSEQGSIDGGISAQGVADHDLAIVTYWRSFEQHERSHADAVFREKFGQLAAHCEHTSELGYELLWQGQPQVEGPAAATAAPAGAR